MRLVDHEDVEGEPLAGLRVRGLRVHVAQQPLGAHLRQPRHAHDHPREELERVGVQTVGTAHLSHQLAVDDREVQTELLAHLVLPLQRQARRADDHRSAGPMPQEQLLDHQSGLDGLAEADVVGEQQVGARGTEGATKRLELVGLDVHA